MFFSWSLAEAWAWFVQLPYLGGVVLSVLGWVVLAIACALPRVLSRDRCT